MDNKAVEAKPDALINALDAALPGARILLFEVSRDHLECVELLMGDFGNYRLSMQVTYHQWVSVTRQHDNLAEALEAFLSGEWETPQHGYYTTGYILGDVADDVDVQHVLSQLFQIYFSTVRLGRSSIILFPRREDSLKAYLNSRPCTAPYRLEMRPAAYIGDDLLAAIPISIFEQGDLLRNTVIKSGTLVAPLLNQTFRLVFYEIDENADPQDRLRVIVYYLEASQKVFQYKIVFDRQNEQWDIDLRDAKKLGVETFGQEFEPPAIITKEVKSNLVFLIQASLGIYLLNRHAQSGLPPAGSTTVYEEADFQHVYHLYKQIIDKLAFLAPDILVVFFGDEQDSPPELEDLIKQTGSTDNPISYYPDYEDKPCFVPFADVQKRLTEKLFMQHQSLSMDWHQSLERAMYFLAHEVQWDGGERVAVWIGQSPPHIYAPQGKPPPSMQPGFTSPIDFDEQLEQTLQQNISHIALFVGHDLPDEGMRKEARRWWQKIGQQKTFEVDCSVNDSVAFGQIAQSIEDSASFTKVRLITPQKEHFSQSEPIMLWALTNEDLHLRLMFRPDAE